MQGGGQQGEGAAAFIADLFDQVSRLHHSGSMRHTFQVAGMPVDVVSPATVQAAHMDRYLGTLSASPFGSDPDALTIWLCEVATAGGALPGMEWLLAHSGQSGLLQRYQDDRYTMFYNAHSQLLSSFDAERGLGLQVISAFESLPKFEWASPLRELLGWTLSRRGRPLVHASAVAGPSGGAIFVGPSGSGKSTTAAIVTQLSALEFISDDFCVLSQEGDIPKVHSLYRAAKLMPRWQASLPGLTDGDYCADMGKTVYRLPSEQVRAEAPIKCLYLPVVCDTEHSEISFVGPGSAMRRLAPSTLFQHASAGPHEMRLMAQLVRQVPAFEIKLGRDPQALADTVAAHLEARA